MSYSRPLAIVLALGLSACVTPHPPAPAGGAQAPERSGEPRATAAAMPVLDPAPAEWRPSDRWVYQWTLGTETGTKTAEVVSRKEVNGVAYYVVRIGEGEHYYTLSLDWAGVSRDGVMQARVDPPQPWFHWPLAVGTRWTHDGRFDDRTNGTHKQSSTFAVVGIETVQVPAGTYQAVKVVRETADRDTDEYWYAPDVRWYVRWVGRRGDLQFEEQLTEHRAARPLVPAAVAPR